MKEILLNMSRKDTQRISGTICKWLDDAMINNNPYAQAILWLSARHTAIESAISFATRDKGK